jgi:septum formation protein
MTMKHNKQMVILASRSPRRIELLKQVGIECIVLPADIDESLRQGELPAPYVKRLAKEKALATAANMKKEYSHMIVLAADTTVSVGDEVLGKPESDQDAARMLALLSGTKHAVHTAVAAYHDGKVSVVLKTTTVKMAKLTTKTIDAYIASGEQRDKAGSYGIQGKAAAWIEAIEGSYSGVMGLPLFETVQLMNKVTAASLKRLLKAKEE